MGGQLVCTLALAICFCFLILINVNILSNKVHSFSSSLQFMVACGFQKSSTGSVRSTHVATALQRRPALAR